MTILLGVSSSISAYKAYEITSALQKQGHVVRVVMTENATKLIAPLTFETLTQHKAYTDTFARDFDYSVEHISLAKECDIFAIAPATANVIAKLAHGIADDMLTTTALAFIPKQLVGAPAMNTAMWNNPATQDNIKTLKKRGVTIVPPEIGRLACGDEGTGKLASPLDIVDYIYKAATPQTLFGKNVVVTAGGTKEAIDPVRFITNHSTGKQGVAIARECWLKGADVTLVTPDTVASPHFAKSVQANSAEQMYGAVKAEFECADILIMTAAVADFRPANIADGKIKKSSGLAEIPLEQTTDILSEMGKIKKPHQKIVGFCMETDKGNLVKSAQKKLSDKNCDMIVANSLTTAGSGFGTDTNVAMIVTNSGTVELPIMSKSQLAEEILNRL
jgi:phosphopantothenoylcysteine decarboxylase/phosphopantothenate--cysteine ligase, prokaryotic